MTFTDAEARIYEELGQVIRGEFNVVGITRTELHDIFIYDDADVWYKVKVKYETADADSEKAKKVTQNFLVTANSVKEAYERIKECLSTLLVDFEIPSIVVSPIVEIFPFAENLDKEIDRRPMNEVESSEEQPNGGAVFSASGFDEDDSEESEIEDVTSKDE
jgi:type III secretion system FlhB-like substrate exporter